MECFAHDFALHTVQQAVDERRTGEQRGGRNHQARMGCGDVVWQRRWWWWPLEGGLNAADDVDDGVAVVVKRVETFRHAAGPQGGRGRVPQNGHVVRHVHEQNAADQLQDRCERTATAQLRCNWRRNRTGERHKEWVALMGDGDLRGEGDFVDGGCDAVTMVASDHQDFDVAADDERGWDEKSAYGEHDGIPEGGGWGGRR